MESLLNYWEEKSALVININIKHLFFFSFTGEVTHDVFNYWRNTSTNGKTNYATNPFY